MNKPFLRTSHYYYALSVLLLGWATIASGQECAITITNPANGIEFLYETEQITLQGTADASVQGHMSWQNLDDGASGIFPVATTWSKSGIGLAVGTNRLVVSGSDAPPAVVTTNAWDNGSQSVYNDSWVDGSNGGAGFGSWLLYTSAEDFGNGGHFMAQGQGNLNIGPRAWGMYANSGQFTAAIRPLTSPLQVGQTLQFSIDHNQINSWGWVGVDVFDADYNMLWSCGIGGNNETYYVNDFPSDIYWTDQGLSFALTLATATSIVATITTSGGATQIFTNFISSAIDRVHFFNYDAGFDGPCDVYVNHLRVVTETISAGNACSDTVTVVRAAYEFTNAIPLFINEVMASNETIPDEDGDTSDWIELYYAGATPLNLNGFGLTDNTNAPFKWTFPAVTMNPNSFLRVWASGKNRRTPGQPLHTSYSIAADGEDIMLTHSNGVALDLMPGRALPVGITYGRKPDGVATWFYFDVPTPGAANNQVGYQTLLNRVALSVPAGLYSNSFDLALSSIDTGVVIRYTTDGSIPTTNSQVYGAPISVQSRAGQTNNITMIPYYAGFDFDEAWLPPDGEVFKLTTVRARAFRPGAYPSPVETRSYLVDPASTNRYSMAIISLTTDNTNLFYSTGIYNNPFNRGPDWERPAHIELFEEDGSLGFAQDVGIRIHGGTTRNRPRKSLRVYARAEYGKSWIEYPLFPDKPVTRYKRFLLRNSGNDWGRLIFRDSMMQSLMKGENLDTQYTRPAIVFFNGEYWGIHNIRDRYDDRYLDTHYGTGAETNITMMENNSVYDRGDPAGLTHYNNMRTFLNSPGVANPTNYAYIQTQMDIDNFINMQAANIFFRNTDWPGNNLPYWRYATAFNPDAPYGLDGRWRWMLLDTDFGFGLNLSYVEDPSGYGPNNASHNTLAFAYANSGPAWPNPPWSTFILRRLTENTGFRHRFINRMADLLNTSFSSNRVVGVVNDMAAQYAPEMAEHIARWRRPSNTDSWFNHVQIVRTFGGARAGHMRAHIISQFAEVTGTFSVAVNVNNPSGGHVRVNSINILPETPGVAAMPYPWNGIYFAGVPVEITAIPQPGYVFAGWAHDPGSTSATITVTTTNPVTALFEEAAARQLIHYWNFNTPNPVLDVTYTIGGGSLAVATTAATNILQDTGQNFFGENARFGDLAGTHLRLNWPLVGTNMFALPSTGFTNILVQYEARRSGQGAGLQVVDFTTDGSAYLFYTNITVINGTPELQTLDFSSIPAVDNNPNFGLRIRFEQGVGGVEGNNRFDNFTVEGWPIPGENFPPVPQAIPLQTVIELGSNAVLNASDYFTDADPLTFTASSSLTNKVGVAVDGNTVTLTPLERGDAAIALVANDGVNAPVTNTFRVLVYPQAFALENTNFAFAAWNPDTPEHVYPEHMLFLQSDQSDTLINTPLLFAYHIPHTDYALDDSATIGFPYNNTVRTRLNGLGNDGIAFINTGRGRDLGGALLALDTRAMTNVSVSWLGGTILPNTRIYAIRLQVRLGTDGPFVDVRDGANQPVEYIRNAATGHSTNVPTVSLPADVLDEPYVQVLWRYYLVSGTSGARAQLRLDDIAVSGGTAPVVYASVYPTMFVRGSFNGWSSNTPMALVADYTWEALATFTNDANPRYKFEVSGGTPWSTNYGDNAQNGVADFDGANIQITEGDGTYRITFNDQTKVYTAVKLDFSPVFLPGGTAPWNVAGNWQSGAVPDAPGALAIINQPEGGNRNVDLTASVTIGNLVINNGDSEFRNRIRGEAPGVSLIFAATNGPAQLTITGGGTGFVEFEVVGGMVLATDLVVSVTNILGDVEYGALRMRTAWTGPGGLRKTGPGMASFTGSDKAYTGETIIEHGVLALSQPSSLSNSAAITVMPGGQLRLTSANDEFGARQYAFGGPLLLDSQGRNGVPLGEQYGVLGALRYEPGLGTNTAIITAPVEITGYGNIHVSTAGNTLRLEGPLSGHQPLVKTGGGRLVLAHPENSYSATIFVSNAVVEVLGNMTNASMVATEFGVIAGSGRIQRFFGGFGTVAPGHDEGPGLFTAESASGMSHYAFVYTATGMPVFAEAAQSGNALLRLTGASPFDVPLNQDATVSVYLDVPSVGGGPVFGGGFFSDAQVDFHSTIAGATWNIYIADPAGSNMFRGVSYRPYDGAAAWTTRTDSVVAYFGDSIVTGRILTLAFAATQTPFQQWQGGNFNEVELLDNNISGPYADPGNSGVANFYRYATGLGRHDNPQPALPRALMGPNQLPKFIYRRLLDPLSGALYFVQWVETLADHSPWQDALIEDGFIEQGAEPVGDGITEDVTILVPENLIDDALHLRLKIVPEL